MALNATVMAQLMWEALSAAWPDVLGDDVPAPAQPHPQMRWLFEAIAQGVIEHLAANPEAFQVQVGSGAHSHSGTVTEIEVV